MWTNIIQQYNDVPNKTNSTNEFPFYEINSDARTLHNEAL